MMLRRPGPGGLLLLIGGSLMLAACGARQNIPGPETPATDPQILNWRSVATKADRLRLRDWREAWATGLERARRNDAAKLAAEGALFDEIGRAHV